jgi:hypothetical protein
MWHLDMVPLRVSPVRFGGDELLVLAPTLGGSLRGAMHVIVNTL